MWAIPRHLLRTWLIDPSVDEQLYPRDFIVDLPRPAGYFGPERLFGRERISQDEEDWHSEGLDVIRRVPDSDVAIVRPPAGRGRPRLIHPGVASFASDRDQVLRAGHSRTKSPRTIGQALDHACSHHALFRHPEPHASSDKKVSRSVGE